MTTGKPSDFRGFARWGRALAAGLIMAAAAMVIPASDPTTPPLESVFFGMARAEKPAVAVDVDEAGDEPTQQGDEPLDDGVYLPSDRQRQRQIDRAIRLLRDRRWSDAAVLLDEILASDNDSFYADATARRGGEQAENDQKNGERRRDDTGGNSTLRSLKRTAADLIGSMDAEPREAYELQFRAKADRGLQQAIDDGDIDAVVAVARRWFHTPAGSRAALLLAVRSLEQAEPYAAIAWLDRLRAGTAPESFEPTLSVMEAIAWMRAGDRQRAVATIERARQAKRIEFRLAGRDLRIAYPSGGAEAWLAEIAGGDRPLATLAGDEWRMPGGSPGRTAVTDGFRPLLAPRYRVSLARHPDEAKHLESYRRAMADQEICLLPSGQPLAVSGKVLVHSMLGVLAVDFETGKRVWMQPGAYDTGDDLFTSDAANGGQLPRAAERVFEDATCSGLVSDGTLVFAVESPRDSRAEGIVQGQMMPGQVFRGRIEIGGGEAATSNALSAYEIAGKGRLAWRISGREAATVSAESAAIADGKADGKADGAETVRTHDGWFLGPPLPVGRNLFVLVEEKGGIRLDAIEAATGRNLWAQPLAELDESRSIDKPAGRQRRLAGLSPSLADGVLVCPTGAGAVIGVDIATRSLSWAYRYQTSQGDVTSENGVVLGANVVGNGMIVQRGPNGFVVMAQGGDAPPSRRGWLDGTPLVADGRILVSPRESGDLHCLDLRTGRLVWKRPRLQNLYVAGVADGKVIVVGRRSVDAISLAKGERIWAEPLGLGTANPSGRGCIARGRLFLPLDTPEVAEIDLAAGTVVGRSAGRGGNALLPGGGRSPVPGNLIVYRGEVISQSGASLDVFHQAEPLEKEVETALNGRADDPWALFWKGQLLFDRGRIGDGIASIEASHRADSRRVPGDAVADAILFALEQDFSEASAMWPRAVGFAHETETKSAILRTAVDGFLGAGNLSEAWAAYRTLVFEPAAGVIGDALVVDRADPTVACAESRWMRGRLRRLVAGAGDPPRAVADASLRKEMDAAMNELLDKAAASSDPVDAISRFLERSEVDGPKRSTAAAPNPPQQRAQRMLCEQLATNGGLASADSARNRALSRELLLLSMIRSGDDAARRLAADAADRDHRYREDIAWPMGRVAVRRDDRHARTNGVNQQRFVRTVPIQGGDPPAEVSSLGLPGLRLSYDAQAGNSLLATDAFGRRLGEPLTLEDGPARFGLFGPVPTSHVFDGTVAGRVVVVRCGGTVTAFELAAHPEVASKKNRRLWSMAGPHGTPVGNAIGGAIEGPRRNNAMPLGMRIVEPAGKPQQGMPRMKLGRATTAGVPILVNHSLEMRDLLTGATLWTRHRISPDNELVGDERFLTVVPRDGKGAVVLSTVDGSIERRCDLPPREMRLCSSGRRIVVIEPTAGPPGGRVTLALVDPADGGRSSLGEFPGDAFAAPVGASSLAVVAPDGRLMLIDLETGTAIFDRVLDQMPEGIEGLVVLPWEDRLVVIVPRRETSQEQLEIERLGTVGPIPQAWNSEDMSQVMTGSIWSLDRATGESLWPMPATVLRHGLQLSQPPGSPVLVFARQVSGRRGDDRPKLGLLCLDKRTGHAVCDEDRLPLEHNMLASCEVAADPVEHRVAVEVGGTKVVLAFDGSSMAPRPPYQAAGAGSRGNDVWRQMEQWMKKAIEGVPF